MGKKRRTNDIDIYPERDSETEEQDFPLSYLTINSQPTLECHDVRFGDLV